MINDTENATIYTAIHIISDIPNQNIKKSNSINREIERPNISRCRDPSPKIQRWRFPNEKKKAGKHTILSKRKPCMEEIKWEQHRTIANLKQFNENKNKTQYHNHGYKNYSVELKRGKTTWNELLLLISDLCPAIILL